MKHNEKTFRENPHHSLTQTLEDINIVNPNRIVHPHQKSHLYYYIHVFTSTKTR